MTIPEWPAKPVPPEEERLLPEWAMLWRGLVLAWLAVVLLVGGLRLVRAAWLLLPVALPLIAGAALAAWAAAIHLTGGEKFDDHELV
ncbi:MAG: hypothetical protein IT303_16660 [Dehalococcoidia bacterium]|nr:hypothetical protein [Dehalococcoidia bacterium]